MRNLVVLSVLSIVAACGGKKPISPPPPISQGAQPQQTPQAQGVGGGSATSNAPATGTDSGPPDRPTDKP